MRWVQEKSISSNYWSTAQQNSLLGLGTRITRLFILQSNTELTYPVPFIQDGSTAFHQPTLNQTHPDSPILVSPISECVLVTSTKKSPLKHLSTSGHSATSRYQWTSSHLFTNLIGNSRLRIKNEHTNCTLKCLNGTTVIGCACLDCEEWGWDTAWHLHSSYNVLPSEL